MRLKSNVEVRSHALLSASSSSRWLNCPPSARLAEHLEDTTSDFAAEGTDAHTLCEFKLRRALGLTLGEKQPVLKWYSQEMEDYATDYVAFILELVNEARKSGNEPIVLVEQRLDYSRYVQEGFGTGDAVIVAGDTLHVVDYKHGRGVLVDAHENTQMMLYALGALELFDFLFDIKHVNMTIYQPRIGNISTYQLEAMDLVDWAENTLSPIAKLAYEGKGEFKCGDHCQFCKAKAICRERSECNMRLAAYDFSEAPVLADDEIEEILSKVDHLVSWANDIKTYALNAAIRGKQWQNWKIVQGRSNRKYSNETAVAEVVKGAGLDPYEQKLVTITELERRIGKARFNELLAHLIIKPEGKPTLVPRSDKREEVNTAAADFKEE